MACNEDERKAVDKFDVALSALGNRIEIYKHCRCAVFMLMFVEARPFGLFAAKLCRAARVFQVSASQVSLIQESQ